jgi:hypothetical protein
MIWNRIVKPTEQMNHPDSIMEDTEIAVVLDAFLEEHKAQREHQERRQQKEPPDITNKEHFAASHSTNVQNPF